MNNHVPPQTSLHSEAKATPQFLKYKIKRFKYPIPHSLTMQIKVVIHHDASRLQTGSHHNQRIKIKNWTGQHQKYTDIYLQIRLHLHGH